MYVSALFATSVCFGLGLAVYGTIYTPCESGADIVHAVVEDIERSGIFPPENELLRRLAYVESKDGTDPRTYRLGHYGGIWQVYEIAFRDTQDTRSHPGLGRKFSRIKAKFGIDWVSVRWQDLQKPLYSGLAARLYLSNIPAPIPPASDIWKQGQYWKKYYNTALGAGSVSKFVEDVATLIWRERAY